MRRWLPLLLLFGGGCATPAAARRMEAADDGWKARLDKLATDPSPEAARARASMIFDALALEPHRLARLGLDPSDLKDQGVTALLQALRAMPGKERLWRELDGYINLPGGIDDEAVAQTTCALAAAAPTDVRLQRRCGDFLSESGHVPEAITHWRAALDKTKRHESQLVLIGAILKNSEEPDKDLAGVPPLLVQQAIARQDALERRADQEVAATRSANGCFAQCRATAAACKVTNNPYEWDPFRDSQCDDVMSQCAQGCQ